jgi:subtilisin
MMRVRAHVAAALTLLSLVALAAPPVAAADPPRRYIVVLDEETASQGVLRGEGFRISRVSRQKVGERVSRIRSRTGVRTDRVFRNALPGFSARLTRAQVRDLLAEPGVAQVVPDTPVTVADEWNADSPAAVTTMTLSGRQVIPTGIRRVRAHLSPIARIDGVDERVPGNVAVLDTGIAAHSDLVVAGGRNCTDTGGASAWRDRHGHGTHVAGTIGAIDNGRGVVGVAPGVKLWAVKVMGNDGKGWASWVICGLDWVAGRTTASGGRFFDVVNMSISGPIDTRGTCANTRSPYQAATCRLVAMGIPVVGAAGNKSRDARHYRPGGYENVITVSALADFDGLPGGKGSQADICPGYAPDRDDTFANFSNFGPDIDLIAPGKCILSTFLNDRYALMSGTSMATPHVAGAVVLFRVEHPDAGPLQIQQALVARGSFNWRTRTDPDGKPDPLLQIVTGPPPTFKIEVKTPVVWLGREKRELVPVDAGRDRGHWMPIRLTANGLPAGVELLRSIIKGGEGPLRLRSAKNVKNGDHVVRVRATDGELRSNDSFRLRIDAKPPTGSFTTPAQGTTRMTSAVQQALTWTDRDTGGSGMARRELRLQTGAITKPGSCAGADWEVSGDPITGPSPQTATDLQPGLCHRWRLRLVDGARNATNVVSGAVLVDTEPPPLPRIVVSGTGVHQAGQGEPVWFAASRAGSMSVVVRSVDPHSGTRDLRVSGLDTRTGWDGPAGRTVDGARATFTLSWSKDAPANGLRTRATDRVGLRSDWATLELRPDASAPVSATWVTPAPGSSAISGPEVVLEYEGGSDTGSGLDPVASVRQQRGAVVNEGSCAGVSWSNDGPAVPRASGATVSGLQNGMCYRWLLTSRDRVGNAGVSRTSGSVLVDAVAPTVSFSSPSGSGTVYHAATSLDVDFRLTDGGGSGIDEGEVRRQVATPTSPGSCSNADWKHDGPAAAVTTARTTLAVGDLASGRCYRWQVTASDRAGNERTVRSASVLVDTDPPPPAEAIVVSGAAWAAGPSGPVWYRAGSSGSFVLGSRPAEDEASGIEGTRFGALSPSGGWAAAVVSAAFVAGRPATRTYSFTASAGDTSVRLTSRDRAGNEGPPVTVQLRADSAPPSVSMTGPAAGTETVLQSDRVTIDWTDSDGGSGVASRVLQRQRARPDSAGSCGPGPWSADGPAVEGSPGIVMRDLKMGWCYRWRLAVRDRVGHVTRAFTGAYRLSDAVVLDVDTLRARLRNAQLTAAGAAPLRLTWVIEKLAGIANVTSLVDRTQDNGRTWKRQASTSASRLDLRLPAATNTVFAIRARDGEGNRSSWEESDRLRLLLIQEHDARVRWAGGWTRVNVGSASGGALRRTGKAGARATLPFNGVGVAVVVEQGPNAGSVTFRVDGTVVATRSLRRAAGTAARQVLVVAHFPTGGQRTLQVEAKGDGRVAIDAFLVLRALPTDVQR